MTEHKQKTKKISRRDAIKLLGAAAGATVLANLPSKWSTPELASGVLPAHAQTSGPQFIGFNCQPNVNTQNVGMPFPSPFTVVSSPAGVSVHWAVFFTSGVLVIGTSSGDVLTNGSGIATVDLAPIPMGWIFDGAGEVSIDWTLTNPAQAIGVPPACEQTNTWNAIA